MQKYLVIVESPSKAKTINNFVDKNYKIISSKGHIIDLPENSIGIDIKNNFLPKYIIIPDRKNIADEIIKESKKVDKILIATDDDREGEAIGWHIINLLKINVDDYEKYSRIVFHEITKTAIQKAIENPRLININLVNAQQARRVLDRLVGYKLSPILWSKISKGLSAGRVQSVAVRLVVEKEREIEAFIPEESWNIYISSKKDNISFTATSNEFKNQQEIENIIKTLIKKDYIIEQDEKGLKYINIEQPNIIVRVNNIIKKESKKTPPPPFTTSTLQQEASVKLGYSVKQTMLLAQQLYEGVDIDDKRTGLITYMRTDSLHLSDIAIKQATNVINDLYGEKYICERKFKTKIKGAQEAHEAIRPTDFELTPQKVQKFLEPKLFKLYKLIWERAIASQMSDAKLDNTTIEFVTNDNIIFTLKGQNIVFDGFLKLYQNKEKDDIIPQFEIGEIINIDSFLSKQKFSQPPSRYTEATLVKKLESEGIGRPSTYAPIITTIQERRYVEKTKDNKLKPTKLGIIVTDFLIKYFPTILDYKFTAKIEDDFDKIEEGKSIWYDVVKNFYIPFEKTVDDIIKNVEKIEQKTDIKCELCGSNMLIKNSRFGQFLSCSNYPKCKNKKAYTQDDTEINNLQQQYNNEICELCGSNMVVKKSKFGYYLSCSNYPKCKNTKSIQQKIDKKCPKCNEGDIIIKKTKKGKIFYSCNKYPQCDFVSWKKP